MSEKLQNYKEEMIFYLKHNKKQVIKVAALVFLFLLAAFLFFTGGEEEGSIVISGNEISQENANQVEQEVVSDIYVDVGGAVNAPGVVILSNGSRVFEAIAAAGGLKPESNVTELNLAAVLNDGDKIYIPTISEVISAVQGGSQYAPVTSAQSHSGKVNLNRATADQLQTLPGVGPAMAERILEYRATIGAFKNVKELMNVSGIGEKTFKKFEEKLEI